MNMENVNHQNYGRARDGKRIFGNVKGVPKTKLSKDPQTNGG